MDNSENSKNTCGMWDKNYSRFQLYDVYHSPLIACGEGVGGGVLVPHNMGKCCICEV